MSCVAWPQALKYAWPLRFTVDRPGYTKLEYLSYVVLEGILLNSADTPLIVPARIPMMVLRDPPGEQREMHGAEKGHACMWVDSYVRIQRDAPRRRVLIHYRHVCHN